MTFPWNLVRFRVDGVAGYRFIQLRDLVPGTNLILGQNGTGKSSVLEAMVVALNHVAGRHLRDTFCRTYQEARFELEFAASDGDHRFSCSDIRGRGGSVKTEHDFAILQFVENRRAKGIVGRHGSHWQDNPNQRYEAALSETKRLLLSSDAEEQSRAAKVLDLCAEVPEAGRPQDWDWIREETRRRGQTHARPLSCGQFDILALSLDLVRFREQLRGDRAPSFVFIDNLEAFIHAACFDSVLALVRRVLPHAQVFIACHSVKLLLGRASKSVFWLPRDARTQGYLDVGSIRTLGDGARAAFFELHGEDVSSGVLSLISMLESPHYAEWLAQCANSCFSVNRSKPGTDPQMRIAVSELPEKPDGVVLDFGAGGGDLLTAITTTGLDAKELTYLAFDPEAPQDVLARLRQGIARAVADKRIGTGSRVVRELSEAPRCDLIGLCNVCHAMDIPTVAGALATLLCEHLLTGATMLIIELRTLGSGEGPFYLWTPAEWADVFADIQGLKIETATLGKQGHPEGIDATLVRQLEPLADVEVVAQLLEEGLWDAIPRKQDRAIRELARLKDSRLSGHDEAWRQRRVAFLCAQLAWLSFAQSNQASPKTPIDDTPSSC